LFIRFGVRGAELGKRLKLTGAATIPKQKAGDEQEQITKKKD